MEFRYGLWWDYVRLVVRSFMRPATLCHQIFHCAKLPKSRQTQSLKFNLLYCPVDCCVNSAVEKNKKHVWDILRHLHKLAGRIHWLNLHMILCICTGRAIASASGVAALAHSFSLWRSTYIRSECHLAARRKEWAVSCTGANCWLTVSLEGI